MEATYSADIGLCLSPEGSRTLNENWRCMEQRAMKADIRIRIGQILTPEIQKHYQVENVHPSIP